MTPTGVRVGSRDRSRALLLPLHLLLLEFGQVPECDIKCRIRPYTEDSTGSCQITEVKPPLAELVLPWVTRWEPSVLDLLLLLYAICVCVRDNSTSNFQEVIEIVVNSLNRLVNSPCLRKLVRSSQLVLFAQVRTSQQLVNY